MPHFTNTSSYQNQHQSFNNTIAAAAPAYNTTLTNKNTLNPLACEDDEMHHNNNALRAASHVSMEHSPQAHEYNPTCDCGDCQYLLKNFTNYCILDAYTADHLKFEAAQQQEFGRVPCVDGHYSEYGYTSVHVGNDAKTGEALYETQYVRLTGTYLFHNHLHHMSGVSAEVRARSYDRYYTNKIAIPAPKTNSVSSSYAGRHQHHNNNNNNNFQHQQYQYQSRKKPSYVMNGNAPVAPVPSYNNNNTTTAVATAPSYYNNNNSNNSNAFSTHASSYNNATTTAAPHYSESEIVQAKRSVAFSGVATLGN